MKTKYKVGDRVFLTKEGFEAYSTGWGSEWNLKTNLKYGIIDKNKTIKFYDHSDSFLGEIGCRDEWVEHFNHLDFIFENLDKLELKLKDNE